MCGICYETERKLSLEYPYFKQQESSNVLLLEKIRYFAGQVTVITLLS